MIGEMNAAVLADKIYVIGGLADGQPQCAMDVYDPASDRWQRRADLSQGLVFGWLTLCAGKLYAVGGHRNWWSGFIFFKYMSVYDEQADAWKACSASAIQLEDVFNCAAVGGKIFLTSYNNGPSIAAEYDPVEDLWTAKRPMPTGRGDCGIAVCGGKYYAIGGWYAGDSRSWRMRSRSMILTRTAGRRSPGSPAPNSSRAWSFWKRCEKGNSPPLIPLFAKRGGLTPEWG